METLLKWIRNTESENEVTVLLNHIWSNKFCKQGPMGGNDKILHILIQKNLKKDLDETEKKIGKLMDLRREEQVRTTNTQKYNLFPSRHGPVTAIELF